MNFRLAHKKKDSQDGFTLIEILIAMTIMAFISMQIFMALRGSFSRRESFLARNDFHNAITLAIGVIERDFQLLYSPKVMVPDWRKEKQPTEDEPGREGASFLENIPSNEQNASSEFWGDLIDVTGVRHSRLIGQQSSLSFLSAGHLRIYQDAPESIFAKVSYEFQEDPYPAEGLEGTFVLMKRVNTDVFNMDEDDNDHTHSYPLLNGITEFQFRYYEKGKETWHNNWDTQSTEFKNIFPDAIEIQLTATGGESLNFEGNYLIRPETGIHGLSRTF
jgi:prepilin-type N-terminal cleavage/methylation domain-containing protein